MTKDDMVTHDPASPRSTEKLYLAQRASSNILSTVVMMGEVGERVLCSYV